MRLIGFIFIFVASTVPLLWYWPLMSSSDPIAIFSQYIGSVALILFGTNQFIATRLPGLEFVFGPLDRIYVLHKWLGITAMVCLGLHDIIDAEINGLRGGPLSGIAEDIGEVGLYGLLILTIASVITFIPYHLWKWSHRLIGIFFILGTFHFFFIEKPFSNLEPLGLYVSSFCLLGIFSYIWLALLRPLSPRGHLYQVASIKHLTGLTEVVLHPQGQGLKHESGQFVFLSLNAAGLSEEHPFTLSAAPTQDRALRFSIKELGDYTRRLRAELKVGTSAKVLGPYGRFTFPKGADPQVWIGAGIGVTPFLAFAESLKSRESGPVKLYYCVRERGEIPYAQELEQIAKKTENLELSVINSNQGSRLTVDRIVDDLGGRLMEAHVFFCGPVEMRKSLKKELVLEGLPHGRFHFEEFQMRSGVGLNRLALWLWNRGTQEIEKRKVITASPTE
ncbi:Flavohemoprotein [Labrenzia sp. THAF82]|uniref:ferredoxin reductase family protein n=1 Tax=Labrenzia sp. THAF82 TaxID=2587861 RepID=UPI001269815B|nr:ferredoxin reductase family protein [Labrenzia sp. THAF82]QFT32511.1 Flavohemoprotein [Labrenzia sp. THAF82]